MSVRTLSYDDECAWRVKHGLEHMRAWASAHGHALKDVVSGSITVTTDESGAGTVTLTLFRRDEDGQAILNFIGGQGFPVVDTVTVPLVQPLPELPEPAL